MKRQVQLFVSREENTSPRYLSCRSNVLTALETRPNESSEPIKKLKLHFDDAFFEKRYQYIVSKTTDNSSDYVQFQKLNRYNFLLNVK